MTNKFRSGAVILVALAWGVSACSASGSSNSPAGGGVGPSSASSDATGPTSTGVGQATVGGPGPTAAPFATTPGSPPLCGGLVNSAPLRSLGDALADLAAPDRTANATIAVRAAAKALRDLDGQASTDLRKTFSDSAAALDRLAEKGVGDPAALEDAGTALGRLSDEVQSTCNFRLG